MSRRARCRHQDSDGCLVFAVALQDHFSRTLQLPGGPKRMPTQLPGASLTLAQRCGLIPKPDKLLSQEDWATVHCSAQQRNECSTANCAICLEPFRAEQQVLLSCSHVFHQQCLATFERHVRVKACPLCRKTWYQQLLINDAAEAYKHACATRIQAAVRGWLCRKSLGQLLQEAPQAHGLKRVWAVGQLSTVRQALTGLVQDAADDLDLLFAELDVSLAVSRGLADPLQVREQALAGLSSTAAAGGNVSAVIPAATGQASAAGDHQQRPRSHREQQQLPGLLSSSSTLSRSRSINGSKRAQQGATAASHRSQPHAAQQQLHWPLAAATAAGAAAMVQANQAQHARSAAAAAAQRAAPGSSAQHDTGSVAEATAAAAAVDWEQVISTACQRAEAECAICLAPLTAQRETHGVALLSCTHILHVSCVSSIEQFQQGRGCQPSCPVCRAAYTRRCFDVHDEQ